MKLSLEWLRKYLPLEKTPEEIEKALTLIGFEVEGIETFGIPPLEKCVVGEVLTREQHPNADRLSVCTVAVGLDEPQQIVCGATNYTVGDRVPVALPGCVLPGDFKIKKSKLRGVLSMGMMCSPRELGMGDDHEGLMILEGEPAIGAPINEVFPDTDTVFDIEITPNRPDCLSHIGLARELGAFFGLEYGYPEVQVSTRDTAEEDARDLLASVTSELPELCPHYTAHIIRGVKVGPSPDWMQRRLKAIGLRPINNVVDVTNYVLHELGQPLHAFDAAQIGGSQIIVRAAKDGEQLKALDGQTYTLNPHNLVIADAEKPMAIAGVMGGLDSSVTEVTTDIVLEAAYFDPVSVRMTSRRLGLSSDSSYRFERGVDPLGVDFAALRAIELFLATAGGELDGPSLVTGEPPAIETEIRITPDYVRERIGFEVEDDAIAQTFEALEFEVSAYEPSEGKYFEVGIPSFRLDLERPVDLVEEFLRIYGTDKIPSADVASPGLIASDAPQAVFVRKVSQLLASRGFNECVNYSLRPAEEVQQWFGERAAPLALANPLASDQTHLRISTLPGLLDVLKLNQARLTSPRRLFEVGKVFHPHGDEVFEMLYVGLLIAQEKPQSWQAVKDTTYHEVTELAAEIARLGGFKPDLTTATQVDGAYQWQEGHAGAFGSFEEGFEARCGLLSQAVLKQWDIRGQVMAAGIAFVPEKLPSSKERGVFQPFSAFPPAMRDLALVVDQATFAGSVQQDLAVLAAEAPTDGFSLESIRVFDVYEGTGLPEGKKSLAFSLAYRSAERTLKDEEVNVAFMALQDKLKERGYTLRT